MHCATVECQYSAYLLENFLQTSFELNRQHNWLQIHNKCFSSKMKIDLCWRFYRRHTSCQPSEFSEEDFWLSTNIRCKYFIFYASLHQNANEVKPQTLRATAFFSLIVKSFQHFFFLLFSRDACRMWMEKSIEHCWICQNQMTEPRKCYKKFNVMKIDSVEMERRDSHKAQWNIKYEKKKATLCSHLSLHLIETLSIAVQLYHFFSKLTIL